MYDISVFRLAKCPYLVWRSLLWTLALVELENVLISSKIKTLLK